MKQVDKMSKVKIFGVNYELNIIEKILNNSEKMETYSKCYEGEVNLTFHKEYIYNTPLNHEKLIRGAQVQRYLVTNNVSQGEILYLDKENYLSAVTSEKSKHYKNRRLIMQGITGINEKYRLKMAIIENSEFCANSANYIIENNKASIEYVLAVLNSKLMNWYFKKLSTNSNVNGYEIDNLPLKISKDDESTLTNLVKEYMKKKKEVNDKEDIEYYEKKINEIVYNIYNLDNREIRYIEES